MPATPTSSMRSTRAPCTCAVTVASAATGPSEEMPVVSARIRRRAVPSSAEPWPTRRMITTAPKTATRTDTSSEIMITVESCGDRNISHTLTTTVAVTAATGSRVAMISW